MRNRLDTAKRIYLRGCMGLALRIGYFSRLNRTSFKNCDEDKTAHFARRRLAWAGKQEPHCPPAYLFLPSISFSACCMSDRQIPFRIGRGFWSRGPGPVAVLDRQTLPRSADENNCGSVMQATVELTQLYSNVHDVLYSAVFLYKVSILKELCGPLSLRDS
jgi:hypothetical protein